MPIRRCVSFGVLGLVPAFQFWPLIAVPHPSARSQANKRLGDKGIVIGMQFKQGGSLVAVYDDIADDTDSPDCASNPISANSHAAGATITFAASSTRSPNRSTIPRARPTRHHSRNRQTIKHHFLVQPDPRTIAKSAAARQRW